MIDCENSANPFRERREAIASWRALASVSIEESAEVLRSAKRLVCLGLKAIDALHVACAVGMKCEAFVTTDDGILSKRSRVEEIALMDPTDFLREMC